MISWIPNEQAVELMQQELARRSRFKQWIDAAERDKHKQRPYADTQMGQATTADLLTQWGKAAAWLPRTVYMPLARAGISPETDFGRAVIAHSPALPHRAFDQYRGKTFTVNAAAHQGPLTAQAGVESPSFVQAGVGDIGQAAGTIGGLIHKVAEPVQRGLKLSGTQQQITGERTHIPDITPDIKAATRTGFAALQAPFEASTTAMTYRSPYAPPLPFGKQPYQRGTENPFSLKQFTLYQMLNGANAGQGFLPGGEAVQKAAEEQRQVRGTVGGHALTPGRVFASQFFEPGSRAFNVASGVTDAGIAWKTDPSALLLQGAGDANQARKLFDTTGQVEAHRNWLMQAVFGTNLDSKRVLPTLEQMATSKNTREIWHALGKRPGSLELARDLASMSTVEGVKDILKLHASEVPFIPKWGYNFSYPLSELRWAHALPHGRIDVDNIDNAATQLERLMVTSKVEPKVMDRVIGELASVQGDRNKLADVAFKSTSEAMRSELEHSYHVRPGRAKEITRFFKDQWESDRLFHAGQVPDSPHAPALVLGGETIPITGPIEPSQMLNQGIPLPNPRAIRQAATKFKPVLDLPGFQATHSFLDFFTDSIFKVGALLRFAWPVRVIAEEQIRMAASGLDSLFNHPINYIAYLTGKKAATDAYEVPWGQLPEDALSHVLGKGATYRGPGAGPVADVEKVYAKHWDLFTQESEHMPRAWADQISMHHMDPIGNATAKAIKAGNGTDALKQSFWDGPLSKVRQDIVNGGGWREHLATRAGADSYIDDVMVPWIQTTTHGHADVLDMITDGGIRKEMKLNPRAVRTLEDYVAQGDAPVSVIGKKLEQVNVSKAESMGAKYNHAVDKMFSFLMSKPTNYLSRSVTFKQFYWQKLADEFQNLDRDTQRQLIRVGTNSNVDGKVLGRMRAVTGSGNVGLEAADVYAKAHAIDATKKLLYDVSERSHFFDAMRIVFPFGEAWKEVISVWSKLAREQPQVIRRGQQILQGARQSGFFYTDPEDGNEYYNVPLSGWVSKKLTGVPFPQRSLVSGLNIVGQGLPGVGPAAQVPLSALIPDKPQWDAVREQIAPYGNPNNLGSFLPGWAQKLQTTDWLNNVPYAGTALTPLRIAFPQTQQQKRLFEGTIDYTMGYLASTGAYDPRDPNDLAKLLHDAKNKAIGLYAIRSAAQSFLPSAPQFVPVEKAKDGKLYEIRRMVADYRKFQDENFDTATQRFIDLYGSKAFLGVQSHTVEKVYKPPTTVQARRWAADNQTFVDAYPEVSGFFAPTSGDFDYNAYLRQLDKGALDQLSPHDWAQAANQRLAANIYAQKRAMVGSNPTKAQEEWLRDWRTELEHTYDGYDSRGSSFGKDITPQRASLQLFKAANDKSHKAIYNSPTAKAVREYEKYRNEALTQVKAAGLAPGFTSPRTEPLRAWLREWGDELSHRSPQFGEIWDRVLLSEVRAEEQP